MARARNIKPGFFKNEDLGELDLGTRLYFIGLWMQADCFGRLEYRPKRLQAEIFPYNPELDVNQMTIDLQRSGFIKRYSIDGTNYLEIVNFNKHQNPHKNEKDKGSDIPEPINYDPLIEEKTLINKAEIEKPEKIGTSSDNIGPTRSDSLFLIPDSLKPDSLNSETLFLETGYNARVRDAVSAQKKPTQSENFNHQAKRILDYLNLKSGKKFQPVKANLKLITARLREGHSETTLMAVIDLKCKAWLTSPKMNEYLRPKTIFTDENFNNYVGELGSAKPMTDDEKFQQAMADPDFSFEKYINQSTFDPGGDFLEGEIIYQNVQRIGGAA